MFTFSNNKLSNPIKLCNVRRFFFNDRRGRGHAPLHVNLTPLKCVLSIILKQKDCKERVLGNLLTFVL